MNDTAELMQRTVPLTWNKPEWMLPEAQSTLDAALDLVDVLIGFRGIVVSAKFETHAKRFYSDDALPIDTQDIEFWAYMPKYPNK